MIRLYDDIKELSKELEYKRRKYDAAMDCEKEVIKICKKYGVPFSAIKEILGEV